jgi:TRAP transporter TAXI family solute receptor
MPSFDLMTEENDAVRRRRRRSNFLVLFFAAGLLVFCAAAGGLYYLLQPVTLRIAVGPSGSDDQKTVQAMADVFAAESRTVRLTPITTAGAVEALALLGAGKADLAVGRGDLEMPDNAQTIAVLRKNYAVLWSPTGSSSKGKSARKIQNIDDLVGRKVGVIGGTPANVALLRVILKATGVEADKVAVAQYGPDKIGELAADPTLDAFMAVGPLDSKITAEAISATARSRGAPKFLAIEASEAIALKHPRYESEEIPPSVFNSKPAWPDDKVETISVSHLILSRKILSEAKAAAFFRQLFASRQAIAEQALGAAHITKPDVEKDAGVQVHRGATDVINGTERSFLDKYGDYFWFALLLLSAIGSAFAGLRRYFNRDERNQNSIDRKRILGAVSEARKATTENELVALQREVDAIIGKTLECYDEGAIEEEEMVGFCVVLPLFDHAIAERRAGLHGDLEAGATVRVPNLSSRR